MPGPAACATTIASRHERRIRVTQTTPVSDTLDNLQLPDARPDGGLERENRRAQLASRMFGIEQEPVRLGRFVLLQHLATGGMGSVHSAYDPQLDRRVALKLLRPDAHRESDRARARLLREAQALARLSHPNVVPVHDVGIVDGQVFVVMELVVGQTLEEWLAEGSRDWREVVRVFLQAGAGLQAAHEMGIIHRDFKPANVILGTSGRVRVLDFGLARGYASDDSSGESRPEPLPLPPLAERASDQDEREVPGDDEMALADTAVEDGDSPGRSVDGLFRTNGDTQSMPAIAETRLADSNSDQLLSPMTATGAVMGTPAYMAPEQLIGASVGPEGDQFSFCASLYEGLYGERPFTGKDLDELRENVLTGKRRAAPKGNRVPRWVANVLDRGLEREPGQRYGSMAELLADLGRDRARTRNRLVLGLAFVALVGATLWALFRAPSEAADICAGAEEHIAAIWSQERRADLERAMHGTGRVYADEVAPRVVAGLAAYHDDWVAMHTAACVAHRRGEQSGDLLDRRMACLDRRRSALASAVAVLLEIQADNLAKATEVIEGLPDIAYCGNTAALSADVAPPEDPALAREVGALRDRLSRVEALEDAGRLQDALTDVDAVLADSERLGYRPLLAEVLLVKGRVIMLMDQRERASKILERAFLLGVESGMERSALEALARYIFAYGTFSGNSELALSYVGLGEALSRKIPDSAFGHALLLNNAGVVHLASGDREAARALFVRALEARDGAGRGDDIELTVISTNLQITNSQRDEVRAALEPVVAQLQRRLGSNHPRTLQMRLLHSRAIDDPERALATREPICAAYQQYHPKLVYPRFRCLYSVGFLYAGLGRFDAAAEILTRLAAAKEHPAELVVRMSATAQGFARLYNNDHRAAIEAFDRAVAQIRPEADKWWFEAILAHALVGRGIALLAVDRPDDAIAALREALASFEKIAPLDRSSDMQRRLAEARWVLARAFGRSAATGDASATDQGERIRELVAQAEQWYRRAGPGYQWRLRELERWRQQRAFSP